MMGPSLRIFGYVALALFFWLVAWAWTAICYSDSADVGIGFFVFLLVVYLVFACLALRLPFTPKAGWPRYLAAACYGVIIMGAWIITGIVIVRWVY